MLIWSWRYTAALVGVTTGALAIAILGSSAPPKHELLGVAFYLGTASILAICGQWYRHNLAWREFRNRDALEREQRRNRDLVEQLERLAREDDLTGIANRRCFDQALDREIARSQRSQAPLALLLCDLDRFKQVNDEHGHLAGDHVLKAIAALLSSRARRGDVVARLGGDEFAVLCPDTGLEDAHHLAEHLVRLAPGTGLPDGSAHTTTLSIGVAVLESSDTLPDHLYLRADEQLYRAKRQRNLAASASR
jgi:diguanylate cyclase (GGDEF)-like protein